MQTLKIKYKTSEENISLIKEYQRQYSNVLHCAYNKAKEGLNDTEVKRYLKTLNNLPLMECHFIASASKESIQLLKTNDKIIFGGKKNFIDRCQNKITREQFLEKRLSSLYSLGEANQKGNRKFQISDDAGSFLFKANRNTHINLEIAGDYNKYRQLLKKLYRFQETKSASITYHLDSEYVYVSFDETILSNFKPNKQIQNRIFSIDLNPNYIGWSIVDWKSNSEFNVVKTGVISIKHLNDKEFAIKKSKTNPNGYPSEHPKRIYLNNKRTHEVFEISKALINTALYYGCSIFSIEDLNMESSDKSKGKRYNALCNNMWNRDKMVQNLQKRCNIFGIKLLVIKANYSSFVGNFLFRDLKLPDMVLASIEISRRAYEFYTQYITKEKDIRKNIIRPEISDFYDRYTKSLEEFGITGEFKDLVELYNFFKKSKYRYRLSLDDLQIEFSRQFSKSSLVLKYIN